MHRIALLALALLAAACQGGSPVTRPIATVDVATASPPQAIDRVLSEGLEHAHQRLAAKYSFQPFALVLRKDGEIAQILGMSGDVLDVQTPDTLYVDPAKTMANLQRHVETEVKTRGDVVAVGFFLDTEVKLPNGSDSRAIEAELEHAAGSCATVFQPYGWVDVDSLAFAAQIKTTRKGTIFPCP